MARARSRAASYSHLHEREHPLRVREGFHRPRIRPHECELRPLAPRFPLSHERLGRRARPRPQRRWLRGSTLPARTASLGNNGTATFADVNGAIDNLFNHPNVGPFIGKLLIQRFTTSNPSPEYIARVTAAFDGDPGNGQPRERYEARDQGHPPRSRSARCLVAGQSEVRQAARTVPQVCELRPRLRCPERGRLVLPWQLHARSCCAGAVRQPQRLQLLHLHLCAARCDRGEWHQRSPSSRS